MICYLQSGRGFHYVFLRDTIRVGLLSASCTELACSHSLCVLLPPTIFTLCLPPPSSFLYRFFYLSAVVEHEWPFRTDEVCSNCSDMSWEVEYLVVVFFVFYFRMVWIFCAFLLNSLSRQRCGCCQALSCRCCCFLHPDSEKRNDMLFPSFAASEQQMSHRLRVSLTSPYFLSPFFGGCSFCFNESLRSQCFIWLGTFYQHVINH